MGKGVRKQRRSNTESDLRVEMINRPLKGVPDQVFRENVLRTLEDMDRRLTGMVADLARVKPSSDGGGPGLNPFQIEQVAGLIGARAQTVIGQEVADPQLQGQIAGGTVTSVNGAGGANISVTGGPITSSGSLTVSITATPTFTTVNATTQYNVGGTKVVGAQGAAVADAAGGATIDAEARTAINTLLARLRAHGLIA